MDPSLERRFNPISSGDSAGQVAIIVPTEYLLERYELDSRATADGDLIFYNVRPASTEALVEGVMTTLADAAELSALAVMPELTCAVPLEDEIGRAMKDGGLGRIQLVVAGSTWVQTDNDELGQNRSCAFPRGGPPHIHHKFSWFRDKTAGREALAEHRRRITILAGPHITYATLICKDALESWVPLALQQLRVRLVVVVSCNAGIGAFQPAAMSISDLGWSTVVVSNVPARREDPREYGRGFRPAAVAEPDRRGQVTAVDPDQLGYNRLLLLNLRR